MHEISMTAMLVLPYAVHALPKYDQAGFTCRLLVVQHARGFNNLAIHPVSCTTQLIVAFALSCTDIAAALASSAPWKVGAACLKWPCTVLLSQYDWATSTTVRACFLAQQAPVQSIMSRSFTQDIE